MKTLGDPFREYVAFLVTQVPTEIGFSDLFIAGVYHITVGSAKN